MKKVTLEVGLEEEPKQETLEETAEKYYPPKTTDLICSPKLVRDAFVAGAKWQAERIYLEDEKSYQLLKKALKMIKSLRGTIGAHPDNVFGSEFRDQSVAAWNLIQEIKKIMES